MESNNSIVLQSKLAAFFENKFDSLEEKFINDVNELEVHKYSFYDNIQQCIIVLLFIFFIRL